MLLVVSTIIILSVIYKRFECIAKDLKQVCWLTNSRYNSGPPRLARPPRPGPCLDSGFQYALKL